MSDKHRYYPESGWQWKWILALIVSAIVIAVAVVRAEDLIVQYVSNYDGDTITVNIPDLPAVFGKHIPVRLRGIDAPEMQGKCDEEKQAARVASAALRRILSSTMKPIILQDVKRDKYFRLLADVIVNGVNVNHRLLGMQMVRPYDGGTRQGWCP